MLLFALQHSKLYKNSRKSTLPPHIFMVADMTHQAMIHNKNPQVRNVQNATLKNSSLEKVIAIGFPYKHCNFRLLLPTRQDSVER